MARKDRSLRGSRDWPHLSERCYRSGKVGYVADCGMQDGKRVRSTFVTKKERWDFVQKIRRARKEQGAAAFLLPLPQIA